MGLTKLSQNKSKMKFLAGIIAATASACEDGMHADPNNCAQFYQCANGHQYPIQECPEGLLYNAEKEYCDWPENVDCSVSKWSCFKDCVGGKWWNPMVRHKCWKNCSKGKVIDPDMYKGFTGKVERKSCQEGIYKHPFRLIFNLYFKLNFICQLSIILNVLKVQ